jgi:hypothetical protein
MPILVSCACGRRLQAEERFAGARADCPFCGRTLEIPKANAAASSSEAPQRTTERLAASRRRETEAAAEITDFLDPPAGAKTAAPTAPAGPPAKPVLQRMLEALLDPQSIQWLLVLGGSLAVLGLIIWLVSIRVFENPVLLSALMGLASLAVIAGGCCVTLKTRFRTAGRALTFLGCVVLPLNLWYYHAQDLVTIEGHLWVAAAACCVVYAATMFVLRDPLFIYAIEAGVTLTAVLLLADLGRLSDPAWLSLIGMTLGLISLHAERAFPPEPGAEFSRARFGMPLFRAGHVQIAASLGLLLCVQLFAWFFTPIAELVTSNTLSRPTNLLATSRLLAAGLWIAGAYAYFYSDLVVLRRGRDVFSAAFCVVMAIITLLAQIDLRTEWLIVALALTALAANAAQLFWSRRPEQAIEPAFPRVGMVLNVLPLLLGLALHIRATSDVAAQLHWSYETGWQLVIAMAVVAACSRLAAWMSRDNEPSWASAYLAFTAGALLIGAAALLRVLGFTAWTQQAPIMMLIPLLYLGASHLWRGRQPEWPLYWVGHAATALILAHVFVAALKSVVGITPVRGETINLILGVVFLEAMAFYIAAAFLRTKSANVYLAAAAGCGAVWQFLGYFDVPGEWYSLIYSALGLTILAASRSLGVERVAVWRPDGQAGSVLRGAGRPAFQCATGILLVAFLSAFLQGAARILAGGVEWIELASLVITAGVAGLAAMLSPAGGWRRIHTVAAVALAGLSFLTLNEFLDLSAWEKLELFCVVVGLMLLAVGHVERFRAEAFASHSDLTLVALWLGAALATVPLLIDLLYHRASDGPSVRSELIVITIAGLTLAAGLGWKTKATTFFGGGTLAIYLLVLVGSILYQPQVKVGAYLAIGGALLFVVALLLSMYRERLLSLPDRIASRQGIFQVMDWR